MNYTATYSAEDNKLRLYSSSRLDKETYDRVKRAGFSWAPRQELFVAPAWTPQREDLLIELAGEIEDESSTMEERAAARAERFEKYSDRRASEAESVVRTVDSISDRFVMGQPILVGHHSEKRARKDAQKIENGLARASKLWETSAYWISRAQNAMRHASYKARPEVTAKRIKRIESDRRKCAKNVDEAEKFIKAWDREDLTLEQAIYISNRMGFVTVQLEGQRFGSSVWSLLSDGKWDAKTAKEWALRHYRRVIAWESRWITHYDNRLAYERAFLTEIGGDRPVATGEEIKVGGTVWIGERSFVVVRTSKGAEGRVVSVVLDRNVDEWRGCKVAVERITKYQAPDEAQAKAAKEAGKQPPIINMPGDGVLEMTKAEWAKIHKDYKATRGAVRVEGFGPFRVRTTIDHKTHRTVRVFLTDEKIKEMPPISTQPRLVPATAEAPEKPVEAPKRTVDERLEERENKARELKAVAKAGVQVVSANQLFPTPVELAWRMVSEADIQKGMSILEPSAGTGRILDAITGEWNGSVYMMAVELNQSLVTALIGKNYQNASIVCGDFLDSTPRQDCYFDRVLMNPPFENADDIKHIRHAWTFLRPGGRLVAICANGPRQQRDLMPWIEEHGGTWEDLPDGTFESSGTNVRTALIVVDKQ